MTTPDSIPPLPRDLANVADATLTAWLDELNGILNNAPDSEYPSLRARRTAIVVEQNRRARREAAIDRKTALDAFRNGLRYGQNAQLRNGQQVMVVDVSNLENAGKVGCTERPRHRFEFTVFEEELFPDGTFPVVDAQDL